MLDLFRQLFAQNFAPHIYCLRNAGVVSIDAVSDALIALSYLLIPVALVVVFRRRRDIRFSWIFALFGAFILCCGMTHLMSIWTLWHPIYRVEAALKAITAIASVLTAVMLWRILPALLAIPSPDALQLEIRERRQAEAEVRRLNSILESRVAERTAELMFTNRMLRTRESELAATEARLRLALDASHIGVWDFDVPNNRFNPDARSLEVFGIAPSQPVSYSSFISAVHPDDADSVLTTLRTGIYESEEGSFNLEFRTIGASDGLIRYVQMQGRALFERNGSGPTPVRYLGVLSDITERRKEQDSLRRANDDLRQFAFAAAHDLQEPMRNVGVTVQLIQRNHASTLDEDGRALLAESIEGAARANNMLRDLLAYLRIVDRDGVWPKAQVGVSEALDEALQNLRSRLEESEAVVQAGDLPVVSASRIHIAQLFQNIIGNSIKYRKTEEAPVIRVQAKRQTDFWLFEIVDNGIGFDPIYADKIFGMFKRLNGRHEYPGNGVGLAICSRIISHYGGKIWAESQPGKGSTFRFTLPA